MTIEYALQQLREAAKEHKRLSAKHRRIARNIMRSIAELQAELLKYGIKFEIAQTGGHSDAEELDGS